MQYYLKYINGEIKNIKENNILDELYLNLAVLPNEEELKKYVKNPKEYIKVIEVKFDNNDNIISGFRKKNRKNITGGYENENENRYGYSCDLISDPKIDTVLYDIYNNNRSVKDYEYSLMLEYVEKYHKELELYYAIENNNKLKQFIKKINIKKNS